LTYVIEEKMNYISRRLVTEVLHVPIQEDERCRPVVRNRIETRGQVNLVWSLFRSNILYTSTFLVTHEHDPWFDVLLGNITISTENLQCPQALGTSHVPGAVKGARKRPCSRRTLKPRGSNGRRDQKLRAIQERQPNKHPILSER